MKNVAQEKYKNLLCCREACSLFVVLYLMLF